MKSPPVENTILSDSLEPILDAIQNLPTSMSRRRIISDAVRELFANALTHGQQPVRLQLSITAETIKLNVRDAGGLLTPEQFEVAKTNGDLTVRMQGPGAGIGLSRSLRDCEKASLRTEPNESTSITVLWRLVPRAWNDHDLNTLPIEHKSEGG